MTRLCIATDLVAGDLLSKLDRIAAAGFTGVEISAADLTKCSATAVQVRKYADDAGLTIDALQPLQNFEGWMGGDRTAAFARLDHKLGLMQDLGAAVLIVTTNTDAGTDPDRSVQDFADLSARAAAAGGRVAIAPLPWAAHTATEWAALDIVKSVGSAHLGLALNSFYTLANGAQAARLRDVAGEHIFHVQLSDATGLVLDRQAQRSHVGVLPGQGDLNLASFVRVIARSGYDGPWGLGRVGRAQTAHGETNATDGFRSVVSLLADVAQSEPNITAPVSNLPGRVTTTGFEFLEFAVDGDSYTELTSLLSALAFRKERTHKTKSVELWRQGAVNIVVNSASQGFAAQARAEHGPCVCDMGLRVTDAGQTVARATLLGAPEFAQPVGVGELDIPAIKGVGGSVVHFIDEKSDLHRVWDIEFDPVVKTTVPQPAGIRRVDHVAQTMRYQDMQSWLTYYLTTFDMEKADVIDVVDPSGIVPSQAISSPEGEVRLNLNGAGVQETFAGTFLQNGIGAGVQHIAFVTDDIFETSALLAASGFKRLTISPNYYADLKVRFDLDDTTLTALQAGNILYDRDGRGAYFQIYSTAFWGGFFFEIVERRGGYDGYGARNAPIRLAAQMQHSTQGAAA